MEETKSTQMDNNGEWMHASIQEEGRTFLDLSPSNRLVELTVSSTSG